MNWRRLITTLRRAIKVGENTFSINTFFANPLLQFASRSQVYEAGMDNVYRTALRIREGAFVDVGANIGQTLLKVLALDSDRQYIGFEPQLYGCFVIDDFIAKNGLVGKSIFPIGLSDKTDIVKLGINRSNDAAASFVDEYRPGGFYSSYKYISTMTGDVVVESLDIAEIALIKVDVEGAELEVIRGLANTITKHKPYILFEVLPHFLFFTKKELDEQTKAVRDRRHTDIQSELVELGYSIFQVQPEGGVKKVDEILADSRKKFDYLAVPAPDPFRLIENMAQ